MIYVLLVISLLVSGIGQAKSPWDAKHAKDTAAARQWIVTPRVSFGAMEPINIDIPKYKPETSEYKILQIALDIENVFPYDVQYESTYLSNISSDLRAITSKRNATHMKVAAAKKAGHVLENETTGLLDASELATPAEKELMAAENANRTELYSLIAKRLRLGSSDKGKVSTIYAQAIKYQKYYALSDEPVFTEQKDAHILTSMASSYKFKTVWDGLVKVLEEEGFTLEKGDSDAAKGTLSPRYKCGSDDKSFMVKLCTIKSNKLSSCKNGPKDESLYSYVSDGTLIWVEGAKDKNKTLVIADDKSEFEEIKYCKDEPRKFDLLEKLSSKLIATDPTKPAPPTAVTKPADAATTAATATTDKPAEVKPEVKDTKKKDTKKNTKSAKKKKKNAKK
jgi:hypothetical protein